MQTRSDIWIEGLRFKQDLATKKETAKLEFALEFIATRYLGNYPFHITLGQHPLSSILGKFGLSMGCGGNFWPREQIKPPEEVSTLDHVYT